MKKVGKTWGNGKLIDVYECEECHARTTFPEEPCWGCAIRRKEINYNHQEEAENNLI